MQGIQIADQSKRVDLKVPTFSRPTRVTNPLFPVSSQASVLFLGTVEDQPFRTEVTLLPETRIIEWNGQRVETLVSQYNAFLGGRIEEIAYDFYAQDDAGNVWYFGEDVFNFSDGVITDTHGTWLAGRDGPPAMIMPANPKVGDVYRPENIPGFVFEEVTVKAVAQSLDGPLGPIAGGLIVNELHMDGGREDKSFAPGYGEFYTASGGDVEALALAVPANAIAGVVPADLTTLSKSALEIFALAGAKKWNDVSRSLGAVNSAWHRYKTTGVPKLIAPRMTSGLAALTKAVASRHEARARHAAISVARSSFDLQLRYRPVAEVDTARFDLWAAQLIVDATAEDLALVNGDLFALDYVRDRIQKAFAGERLTRINTLVEELQTAVADEDFEAVAETAGKLRAAVAGP